MALKHGYKISPVIIMNENKMYTHTDFALKWRLILNKFKIPGVIFWGKYGPLPDFNLEIYNVVGKPI